jgi:hypothetical protein
MPVTHAMSQESIYSTLFGFTVADNSSLTATGISRPAQLILISLGDTSYKGGTS